MKKTLKKISYIATLVAGISMPAYAGGGGHTPPAQDWSWDGIFGTFDRAAAQRGFQVYKEVCSSCHAMNYVSYRNLTDIGFSEAEVKAIAADYIFEDGPNDEGDMYDRAGKPSDRFYNPYPNEKAARAANGGALPPDLSLIAKARPQGADYVYALLTNYGKTPPADLQISEGQYYNPWMSGGVIAMAPPLTDDIVTYEDGTPATVEQMSHDVVTFLSWAAEPETEVRKKTGLKVLIFLTIFAFLMFLTKRKIWKDAK